jgi:hypothetical protein
VQVRRSPKALWVADRLALHQSDLAGALPLLRDCAALAKRLGDASAEAHATEFFATPGGYERSART